MAFEGHICCWHLYGSGILIKIYSLLFSSTCAVILGLYVDYSSSAVGIPVQCGRNICSGAYANNVKCMYISAHGKLLTAVSSYEISIY